VAGLQGELPFEVEDALDEAGELPPGWAWTTLGEVLPLHYGKALPARARDNAGDVDVYGSSGSVGKHSEALSPVNTIVVGRKGSAGGVHFSAKPCWPIDTVYFTKTSSELDARYWYFNLSHLQLGQLDQSTAIPSLSRDNYSPIAVMVPPLAEQRRIVDRIDELFSRIEAGARAIETARAALKRYRKALLKAAVTGELTEDWRASHAPEETAEHLLDRILKERCAAWEAAELAKLKAKGKPPPSTDKQWEKFRGRYKDPALCVPEGLPELPKGWGWTNLGTLFEVYTGATPSRKEPSYWGGEIPWVSSGEVSFCRIKSTNERITEAGLRGSSVKLHPPGTVLLAMIGEGKTRGQCAILDIEAGNNQNAAAIRVSLTPILPDYVSLFLEKRYEASRKEGQGGNQPALNASKVSSIAMPLAPINEQVEIISRVEEVLSRTDAAEATLEAQSRTARALKQSILKAAFTGRLVPQDPRDEPASELLKRVTEAGR
jgi:type I restriction enzyme, S subunit